MIGEKHFTVLEKITPIAQLLEEWSDPNTEEDLTDLKSPKAVFESMSKTLWEVYFYFCEKMSEDWYENGKAPETETSSK